MLLNIYISSTLTLLFCILTTNFINSVIVYGSRLQEKVSFLAVTFLLITIVDLGLKMNTQHNINVKAVISVIKLIEKCIHIRL